MGARVPDHLSSMQSDLNSLWTVFSQPLHTAHPSMSWLKPVTLPVVLRIKSKLKVASRESFAPGRVLLPSLLSFSLPCLSFSLSPPLLFLSIAVQPGPLSISCA